MPKSFEQIAHLLIYYERPERIAHGCPFVIINLSDSLTVAHLFWEIWGNCSALAFIFMLYLVLFWSSEMCIHVRYLGWLWATWPIYFRLSIVREGFMVAGNCTTLFCPVSHTDNYKYYTVYINCGAGESGLGQIQKQTGSTKSTENLLKVACMLLSGSAGNQNIVYGLRRSWGRWRSGPWTAEGSDSSDPGFWRQTSPP